MNITSLMIVGNKEANRTGTIPSHYLQLSEQSTNRWIISDLSEINASKRSTISVLIPSENQLKSGILILNALIIQDKRIIESLKQLNISLSSDSIDLTVIDINQLEALYQDCQPLVSDRHVVLSIFEGSCLIPQLKILESYSMKFEVCVSWNTYRETTRI